MQLSKALPATGRLAALTRPAHADDRNVGGAAADVHDHAAVGLANLQPPPVRRLQAHPPKTPALAPAAMTDSHNGVASMPVMAAGTQTAMRGLKMRERQTSIDKADDELIGHAMVLDDAVRSGRTKSIWAGRGPPFFGASSPTAMMVLVRYPPAPMVGWRKTTPCSSVAIWMVNSGFVPIGRFADVILFHGLFQPPVRRCKEGDPSLPFSK